MRPRRSPTARTGHHVALLALLLLAAPRAAGATVCGSTVRLALQNGADAIFLGVVESSRPSFRHPLTQVVDRVRVLRAWKGVAHDRVDLTWEISERAMNADALWTTLRGVPFLDGDTLLVAAWWKDGMLTSDACALWMERAAERELALLGPGTVPTVAAPVAHLGLWWPWPAVAGVLLLLSAAVLRGRRHAW